MWRDLMMTGLAFLASSAVQVAGAAASEPVPGAPEDVVEKTEVKTRRAEKRDHPSLRFLRDNRDFLRAQLDRLRLETRIERHGSALDLDPRYLEMKAMAAAIAAARDTVNGAGTDLERRQLLASVAELRDLEMQLDLMDSLLVDQGLRLTWLEEDFLGRQETALVVLVRGDVGEATPAGLVLTDGEETLHVALGADQRASLARGGIVQVEHRLVEPRARTLEVSLTGGPWADHGRTVVALDPARDRLTFLELDLSRLDPGRPDGALGVDVWQR